METLRIEARNAMKELRLRRRRSSMLSIALARERAAAKERVVRRLRLARLA